MRRLGTGRLSFRDVAEPRLTSARSHRLWLSIKGYKYRDSDYFVSSRRTLIISYDIVIWSSSNSSCSRRGALRGVIEGSSAVTCPAHIGLVHVVSDLNHQLERVVRVVQDTLSDAQ
ncbi:IQ domain-containing protein IQM5 [Fusarium oxysporum f. sp. albedinis]|nr:IQ domain-containing protein IQM5 [Fusarium oxysporum f. sp. albedinis]